MKISLAREHVAGACGLRPARRCRASSARAVISCTLSTERIWPGIFSSMLWHWSSMNATSLLGAEAAAADHLDEDPEQLERVGRADDQVVVGVEAGVEVERAELPEPQQLRDDELDVGARRVVAGVEADHGPLAERGHLDVRRAPVGHVGVVERRLEELVLEHQPLVLADPRVDRRRGTRPAGPGGPGCRPGPGSWCRRRARSSGRATRSRP